MNNSKREVENKKKKSFSLDKRTKENLYVLLSLFAAVFILYIGTIPRTFNFSDMSNLDPAFLVTKDFFDILKNLRPHGRILTNFIYTFNYFFFSDSSLSYYIVNIILHVMNAFLFFLMSNKLIKLNIFPGTDIDIRRERVFIDKSTEDSDPGINKGSSESYSKNTAFIAALLFSVHPVALFSTSDATKLATLVVTSLMLLSIICFIDFKSARSEEIEERNLKLCVLFGFLAFLGKETAIVLLPIFFALEIIFFDINKNTIINRATIYLLCFLIIETVFFFFPSLFIGEAVTESGLSILSLIMTQARAFLFYFTVIVFPSFDRLSVEYDMVTSSSLTEPYTTLISLFIIVAVMAFVFIRRKKNPLSSFLIFCFFAVLLVESAFKKDTVELSRVYFASCSVFLILSYMIMHLKKNIISGHQEKTTYANFIIILLPIVILPLSYITAVENRSFKSGISLYENALRTAPEKKHAIFKLAEACYKGKDYKKAESHLKSLILKDDKNITANIMLGDTLFALESFAEAEKQYKKVIELDKENIDVHVKLARLYLRVGRKVLALRELKKANFKEPDSYNVIIELSDIYFKLGELDKAQYFLQKAISIFPENPDLHFRAGKYYELAFDNKRALKEYETVLDLDYDYDRKDETEKKIKEMIEKY